MYARGSVVQRRFEVCLYQQGKRDLSVSLADSVSDQPDRLSHRTGTAAATPLKLLPRAFSDHLGSHTHTSTHLPAPSRNHLPGDMSPPQPTLNPQNTSETWRGDVRSGFGGPECRRHDLKEACYSMRSIAAEERGNVSGQKAGISRSFWRPGFFQHVKPDKMLPCLFSTRHCLSEASQWPRRC